MKKCYLLAVVMLLIFGSCSEDRNVASDEVGSLCIASTIEGLELTRAEADVNQFTLILEHKSTQGSTIKGLFSDFPNGTVENIPVGAYDLTLTSHPDGFVPAFEDPWYKGLKGQIPVGSGRTTMVSVECVQANTGITFVFDSALEEAGFGNIVPEMTQDGTTLYFDGENRDAKAYFLPTQVELKIKHGNQYLNIGGKKSQTLDLNEQQLWEVTLKPSHITGSMSILATVKVIDKPTHFIEFELGDEDVVDVKGLSINARTASFLVKGTDVSAMKYGLFPTATVDMFLNLMSEEDFMASRGTDLALPYLMMLNSADGLEMNFDGMEPSTEYTLMIMPTKNDMLNVQRYDFVSAEGLAPAEDQTGGPIAAGIYYLDIYQDIIDGEYADPYENTVYLTKANQENMYIVSGLFMMDDIELIAEYNEATSQLIFTGQDILEYEIFNDIMFVLDQGESYAGVYLLDGENLTDQLIFSVADGKLDKAVTAMEFRIFDVFTEEQIDWIEVSPANNPFRTSSIYMESGNATPMRTGVKAKKQKLSTRAASTNVLRSSVTLLK